MARTRPPERFPALLDAATAVFIRSGVHRAQIDEVARKLGVAKGTIYLLVESKEALFDLVLRRADEPDFAMPAALPVPTPKEGSTLAFLEQKAMAESQFPRLTTATTAPPSAGELEALLGELYDTLVRNRTRIKLVGASAVDWPELGSLWYQHLRAPLVDRWARWLALRSASGHIAPVAHPAFTARLLIESATWSAVHRLFDAAPDGVPDAEARAVTLRFLLDALTP